MPPDQMLRGSKETRNSQQGGKSLRGKSAHMPRQKTPEEKRDNSRYQQLRDYVKNNHPDLVPTLSDFTVLPPYVTWIKHHYPEHDKEVPLGLKVALFGTNHHEDAVAYLIPTGSADTPERDTDKIEVRVKTAHSTRKIDFNDRGLQYLTPFDRICDAQGIQRKYFNALVKFFFIRFGAYPESGTMGGGAIHTPRRGSAFLRNFCEALQFLAEQINDEQEHSDKEPSHADSQEDPNADDTQAGLEEGRYAQDDESQKSDTDLLPRTPQYRDRNDSPYYKKMEGLLKHNEVDLEQLTDLNHYIWEDYKATTHLDQGLRIAEVDKNDPELVFAHVTRSGRGQVHYIGYRHGESRRLDPVDLIQAMVTSGGRFLYDFKFLAPRDWSDPAQIEAAKASISSRVSVFVKWHFLCNRYQIRLGKNERFVLLKTAQLVIQKKREWNIPVPEHHKTTTQKSHSDRVDTSNRRNSADATANNGESSSQATAASGGSSSFERHDDTTSDSSHPSYPGISQITTGDRSRSSDQNYVPSARVAANLDDSHAVDSHAVDNATGSVPKTSENSSDVPSEPVIPTSGTRSNGPMPATDTIQEQSTPPSGPRGQKRPAEDDAPSYDSDNSRIVLARRKLYDREIALELSILQEKERLSTRKKSDDDFRQSAIQKTRDAKREALELRDKKWLVALAHAEGVNKTELAKKEHELEKLKMEMEALRKEMSFMRNSKAKHIEQVKVDSEKIAHDTDLGRYKSAFAQRIVETKKMEEEYEKQVAEHDEVRQQIVNFFQHARPSKR